MKGKKPTVGFLKKYSASTLITLFAGLGISLFVFFLCVFAPLVTRQGPLDLTSNLLSPPDSANIMGTDTLGRDVFSRVAYGGRYSLMIAAIAMSLSLTIGVLFGSFSGYVGGLMDQIAVILMDAFYAFPSYIIALAVAAMLSSSVQNIAFAVGIAYVPQYFRLVRSITITIKERKFIEAEKVVGLGSLRILAKHVLPYAISSIIVILTMGVADSILTVSGLGFLGLGLGAPTPEWGTDLRWCRDVFLLGKWWVVFFPGLMIFISVLGFNLLGEGLNSVFREQGGGRYAT